MDKIKKKKIVLVCTVIALIAWAIFLFNIDIDVLVESMGVKNMHLILFLVAVLSSTSFLTSASFYVTFFAYVSAGFNPLIISIVGGAGMVVGDVIFFFISRHVGDVMSMSNIKLYKKMFKYVSKLPTWGVYLFTYLYASFAPTPNDILILILGALKFKYSRIIPILIVGDITLLFLIAKGIHYSF
ncbi:MAG TPA: hypothetical protein EYG99_02615 [Candidatus Pacebacteria bacterium]|nr:hypothetical protein [Candidatus Paceibacterota bacterium]